MELTLAQSDSQRHAIVYFSSNGELQKAFNLLRTAIPTRWAERGRLTYTLWPIDEAYGCPGERGIILVRWKPEGGGEQPMKPEVAV